MTLEIIPVWKQITPELETELAQFWINNRAIADDRSAAERAGQVVCLARCERGAIIGVSTAHPRFVPRLRQPMYYYRNFIAADFRGRQLAPLFLLKTKEVLQSYDLSLSEPRCLGIIIELENQSLAAHRNQAQWREGFTFIGYSLRGLSLRVWYFEGARLSSPVLMKQVAEARRN
jgi:hypothetical protein